MAAAQPPDLEEVRQGSTHIAKAANRAGESSAESVRSSRTGPSEGPVDINEAIREVIELNAGASSQAVAHRCRQHREGFAVQQAHRVPVAAVVST